MEAVHFLYTRFASDVYSSVRDFVPDDLEARSVTERVFCELPTRMADYEVRKQAFVSWLLDAARDVARSCTKGRVDEGKSWTSVDTRDDRETKGLRG